MNVERTELPADAIYLGKITPLLYARSCKIAARWPKNKPFPRLILDTGRSMTCSDIIRWWQAAVISAGETYKDNSFLLRSVSVYITGDYGGCEFASEDELLID